MDNYVMGELIDDKKKNEILQQQEIEEQTLKKTQKNQKESKEDAEESEIEQTERPVNLLNDTWSFWYSPRGRNVVYKDNDYTSILKNLGQFNSIEDFFSFYCYLKRPSDIPVDHKVCCFRQNARPTWEDYPNGGTWIIMFRKQDYTSINLSWEILLLALIGEEFEDYNIVGALLSTRSKKNLIEIWLKDSSEEYKLKVGEKICALLNIEMKNVNLYFKNHSSSLKEQSTMKGAESYQFTLTPWGETPYIESIISNPQKQKELDNFKLD